LGALKVRIAKLDPKWVCEIDRWPRWGKKVELQYRYVICMAFAQDPLMIANATGVGARFETYYKYSYASFASIIVANYIKHLGWPVKALSTFASPFLVVPTFIDAGMGESGRCGYCVTKEFGNNWRPGAVATDMPLIPDKPVDFGLQDFCEKCQICADACPSGSIPKGEKVVVNGVRRWHADAESCARYWYKIGTPCSICQAVCPFSHPNDWFHDTIRYAAENLPWSRSLLVQGDKAFYPVKKKLKPAPKWLSTEALPYL
jgi:reductive dehalogenase